MLHFCDFVRTQQSWTVVKTVKTGLLGNYGNRGIETSRENWAPFQMQRGQVEIPANEQGRVSGWESGNSKHHGERVTSG